jgi:hypothetical protein
VVKQMTPAERAAYQREWRARQKAKQQESVPSERPVVHSVTPMEPKHQWKSAEAFVAAKAPPTTDVHALCKRAERENWRREQEARDDYAAMLSVLQSIVNMTVRQEPGHRQVLLYENQIAPIAQIVAEEHERAVAAAEFAVDLDEPF